jgi:hypothetical protein
VARAKRDPPGVETDGRGAPSGLPRGDRYTNDMKSA